MNEKIEVLHEICETVMRQLEECSDKLRANGGKISTSDSQYLDMLTHTLKSVKTTIAMMESEDDGYSGMPYSRRGYSYDSGYSYARGRRGARRDSMGRYSREGGDDMVSSLRSIADRIDDPQAKQELMYLVGRM